MKKTISIVGIIISVLMVVSVSIIYIPTFFGQSSIPVTDGDMSPKIMRGSLCFIKLSDSSSIQIGDVIGLRDDTGKSIIRRIVRCKPSNSQMLTKGDNLELLDESPLNPDNIIGISVFSIPLLGFVSSVLKTLSGKLTFGIILIIILGSSIYLIANNKKNKSQKVLSNTI